MREERYFYNGTKKSECITFVNASKVAASVTGRSVKNNSFVLLAVLVLGIGIAS